MQDENNINRPVNPRRRRRTKEEIFKENYLPFIIAGVTFLLCAVFIISGIARSVAEKEAHEKAVAESIAAAEALKQKQDAEAAQLLAAAKTYAQAYDYDSAIDAIDSFSGDITSYPELLEKRSEYAIEKTQLVLWNDPAQVLNLSFQILIADSNRAYKDKSYGSSYNKNFVTIDEFEKILTALYENNYILVSLSDVYTKTTDSDGNVIYSANNLYLPADKRPLILTQTQVNYYTYMTDGDKDKLPDAKGAGFASKLILDEAGKLTNTMVAADGTTVTGAFDLVPILNAFVESHPTFSYRGAKAVLAVTGYDGVFGYRTNPSAEKTFGTEVYQQEIEGAKTIVQALRDSGYEIGCYTYRNIGYGNNSVNSIKSDLEKWKNEVAPILGDLDILVYAQNSDISSGTGAYSGKPFSTIHSYGFNIFLGFCKSGTSWAYEGGKYVRMGRLMVSGSNMAHKSSWFDGIFPALTILDSNRGSIPK